MLTDRKIQAAIKSGADVELNDGSGGKGTGSLRLRVRKGSAVWFGFWKSDGQRTRKSLGKYPDVGLRDARDKFAAEIRSALVAGKKPTATVVHVEKPTVEALFAGYIAAMREAGRVSAGEVERALLKGSDNAADAIGRNRMAADVDASEVSAYLERMYRRGARVGADRTRSYLAAAFNWGIECTHDYRSAKRRDWGIKVNPAAMVRRDTEANTIRDRNLSVAELRALWHALDGEWFMADTADAIRLLICCGQRVRETLRIESSEVDLQGRVWNMPATKSKIRRTHSVPLPDEAVTVLQNLIQRHGNGLLFPPRTGDKDHLSDVALNRAMARWCKRAGVERFQTRDIRRTWKSRAADAGIDRFTRDLIQQHAKGDTGSRHYDRADYSAQMRDGMNRWSEWLKMHVLNMG